MQRKPKGSFKIIKVHQSNAVAFNAPETEGEGEIKTEQHVDATEQLHLWDKVAVISQKWPL